MHEPRPITPLAIEAEGLTRSFGDTRAVDGVDLQVPAGTVYGVLGPNGAGKTTTIRMLATLLAPDGGRAQVLGHDLRAEGAAIRRRIALTGQMASVDEDLTGRENLVLLARLQGHRIAAANARADALLDGFGLQDAADRLAKHHSGGMRRRLDIAASIVVTPDLLFLDEPTTGLDPRSRNQVWEIVRSLVASGTTVLLCTQYLEEADQLASRIAVVDHGRVIAEGTPGQLKASVGSSTLEVRLMDAGRRADAMAALATTIGVDATPGVEGSTVTVAVEEQEDAMAAIRRLAQLDIEVAAFSVGQPSLDEVFLALTGAPADAEAPGHTTTDREEVPA